MPRSQSVCILGAGASGIATIKELKAEGHRPTCFEHDAAIGGLFNYKSDESVGAVYKSLHLTVSNYHMAYSDFMPEGARYHWDRRQYQDYLEEYCAHFDLKKHNHPLRAEGGRDPRESTRKESGKKVGVAPALSLR